MTGVRTFWVAWCCFWALAWLLTGFFTFALGWLMVPVSLAAILLPVGRPATAASAVSGARQPPVVRSSVYYRRKTH